MGYGSSTPMDYAARAAYRSTATGTAASFGYTTAVRSGTVAAAVHESLDPKRLNSLNERIRECLDSTEHPNTIPVAFAFDETGSMANGPVKIMKSLGTLKGLTLRAGLPDAQLLFGAYGDSHNFETAPCQVGQFESGLEMEEWLNNIYLEHNGGGNGHETAGLFLWFMATHSRLDSLDKRGKKGYLFLTGDEISGSVTRSDVETYVGEGIEKDLTMEEVVSLVTKSYNVFFFLVNNGSARAQGSEAFWTKLLGKQNVIIVEDLDHVAELASMIVAKEEGVVDDIDDATALMKAEGVDDKAVDATTTALAKFYAASTSSIVTATSTGKLPAPASSSADTDRL